MNTFSIWNFEKYKDLDAFVEILKKNKNRVKKVSNENWNYGDLLVEFREIDNFGLENIKQITIGSKVIKYILFEVYAEKTKNYNFWFEEDGKILKSKKELMIPFSYKVLFIEHNGSIKSIFFCANSTAHTMIRYMFKEENLWGEIKQNLFGLSEDLFYWIFQRIKDYPNVALSDKIQMQITSLSSYMGSSKDKVNAVRGNGNRVAAMLGTVAFLFSNEQLKAVRPEIQYEGHRFIIELSLVGSYKIWENTYIGGFNPLGVTERNCAICIYTFTELIPKLVECYKERCLKNDWSPKVKSYFLQALGQEIMDRVDSELQLIRANAEMDEEEESDDLDDVALEIDDPDDPDGGLN